MSRPTEAQRPRQRNTRQTSNGTLAPPGPKTNNVQEEKSTRSDRPWTFKRAVDVGAAMLQMTVPKYMGLVIMTSLIFGGCCSNVYALESIIKEEPGSGMRNSVIGILKPAYKTQGLLITFIQFVVVALFTWPAHFSINRPPFFLKPRRVPLMRWVPNILMFFAVNLLNNFAFGYNISVPVHIILRSGGSILTMLVGYVWGKRYTNVQVFSVAMLTTGIIMAAMADAQSKGKTSSSSAFTIDPELTTGLLILFIAQLLSAIMGLYTQLTYAKYGSHWHENLFYSHFLSIPLFLPFFPSLLTQFKILLSSPPISLTPFLNSPSILLPKLAAQQPRQDFRLPPILSTPGPPSVPIPKHILTLGLNALTQFACIRGVNLLGARTTALGVSIVLNLRKLVSLFASIWLFGNTLPSGVVAGAVVVFSSAGIWAWEGQRISASDKEGKRKEESSEKETKKRT